MRANETKKQENLEQYELRKKKASLWDKITRRFLKFLYIILHIKLKIFPTAYHMCDSDK